MQSKTETFYDLLYGGNMEKDDIAWLSVEVEKWEKQGIIDESQARKIVSTYGRAEAPSEPKLVPIEQKVVIKEDEQSKLIAILSIIGAILVGVGVILFVGSNWNKIPEFLKLALLFLSLIHISEPTRLGMISY